MCGSCGGKRITPQTVRRPAASSQIPQRAERRVRRINPRRPTTISTRPANSLDRHRV